MQLKLIAFFITITRAQYFESIEIFLFNSGAFRMISLMTLYTTLLYSVHSLIEGHYISFLDKSSQLISSTPVSKIFSK